MVVEKLKEEPLHPRDWVSCVSSPCGPKNRLESNRWPHGKAHNFKFGEGLRYMVRLLSVRVRGLIIGLDLFLMFFNSNTNERSRSEEDQLEANESKRLASLSTGRNLLTD